MNMNFQRPYGTELSIPMEQARARRVAAGLVEPRRRGLNYARLAKWLLAAGAVGYLATIASAVVLWVIGGVVVGLVALLIAVCVFAENNIR